MAQRRIIPIMLVTGFLGSGKTTMLARWMRSPAMAGAVAIINEFGEVGIDDRLVQASGDMPLMLENGCACCAAGEDLAETLERLFLQQLAREIPPVKRVVIETTGLADPGPILDRLAHHPVLAERYEVSGVVTTFDARHGPAALARHPECRQQLEHATLVVLTKCDLASDAEHEAARTAVEAAAPGVRIFESAQGSLGVEAVIAALAPPPGGGQPHAHHHDHHHDDHEDAAGMRAHHSAGLDSIFLPLPAAAPREALRRACLDAKRMFGAELLRLKGVVRVDGTLGLVSVQLDGEDEVNFSAAEGAPASEAPLGFTIITQHVPAARIGGALLDGLHAASPS